MNIASSRAGQEIVDQAGHRAFVFKWNSLSDITATTSSPWHWAMSPTDLLPWRRIKRMKNQTSAPPLPETPDVSIHMMTRETRSMMALQLLTSVWTEIPTCSSHNLSSKDCTVFSNTPPQPSSPPPRGLPRFRDVVRGDPESRGLVCAECSFFRCLMSSAVLDPVVFADTLQPVCQMLKSQLCVEAGGPAGRQLQQR